MSAKKWRCRCDSHETGVTRCVRCGLTQRTAIDLARCKVKRYSRGLKNKEWETAANNLARNFAPDILECHKCGAPVVSGYCCCNCGDTNPSCDDEQVFSEVNTFPSLLSSNSTGGT